jgi:hypothetical protein
VCPGTLAFLNGTYLDFDTGGVNPYSMYFTDAGYNYRISVPVSVIYSVRQNRGRDEFGIASDGSVSAML